MKNAYVVNGKIRFAPFYEVYGFEVPASGIIPEDFLIKVKKDGIWTTVCSMKMGDGLFWLEGFHTETEGGYYIPDTFHRDFDAVRRLLEKVHPETRGRNREIRIYVQDATPKIYDYIE